MSSYSHLSFRELQELAKSRSLPAKGSRSELIERLNAFKSTPSGDSNYDLYLLKDIKDILRKRGLKLTGNKNELIKILKEDDSKNNSIIFLHKDKDEDGYFSFSYSNTSSNRIEKFKQYLLDTYPDNIKLKLKDKDILVKKGKFLRTIQDISSRYELTPPMVNVDWLRDDPSINTIPTTQLSPKKPENISPNINKIVKNEDMPSVERLNVLSEFFKMDLDKYEKFRGTYLYEWGWLLYLEKLLTNTTHEKICTWVNNARERIVYYITSMRLKMSNIIYNNIKSCLDKDARFIIGLLELVYPKNKRHANALIFDSKNKILTRFEPHGNRHNYDNKSLDNILSNWVKKFGKNWKYKSTIDICPKLGPQTRDSAINLDDTFILKTKMVFGQTVKAEARGFCQAWSLLYIHMRIVNPAASDSQILNTILSWSDKELALKIRKYTEYIVNNIEIPTSDLTKGDTVQFSFKGNTIYGEILDIKTKNVIIKPYNHHKYIRIAKEYVTLVNDPNILKNIKDKYILKKEFKIGDHIRVNFPRKYYTGKITDISDKAYIITGSLFDNKDNLKKHLTFKINKFSSDMMILL